MLIDNLVSNQNQGLEEIISDSAEELRPTKLKSETILWILYLEELNQSDQRNQRNKTSL